MSWLLLLKFVHLASMAVWFGAALSAPGDVERTIALGEPHTKVLLARLGQTARLMNRAGVATLVSGGALVAAIGVEVTPARIWIGLAGTLLVFAVGRWEIRPAIGELSEALGRAGSAERRGAIARRFRRGVHAEHALRIVVLALMVFPIRF